MMGTTAGDSKPDAQPAKVFISYKDEDKPLAQALATALEALGLDPWWDSELRNATSYQQVITEQIASADLLVVLWTARSVKSRWVLAETQLAGDKLYHVVVGSPIIPPPHNIAHHLQVNVDASPEIWSWVAKSIAAHLASAPSPPAPDPLPPPSSSPEMPPKRPLTLKLGVTVAGLAGMLCLLWLPTRYAASREHGLGIDLDQVVLKLPYTWTSVVSVLSAAALVVAGSCWFHWLSKHAWDWKIFGAVGSLLTALLANIGVREVPVRVTATTKDARLVGTTVQLKTRPLSIDPLTICGENTDCQPVTLNASPCALTAGDNTCGARPERTFDRCSDVYPVTSTLEVAMVAGAPTSIPVFLKGQPLPSQHPDLPALRQQLAMVDQDGARVSSWSGSALVLDCAASNSATALQAQLGSRDCRGKLRPDRAAGSGLDVVDCLAAPSVEKKGDCYVVEGTHALPVRYRLAGREKLLTSKSEFCPPRRPLSLCAELLGVSADGSCTQVTPLASSSGRAASRRVCAESDFESLCRAAGLMADLRGCREWIVNQRLSKGQVPRPYRTKRLGPMPCDVRRTVEKTLVLSCGGETCE